MPWAMMSATLPNETTIAQSPAKIAVGRDHWVCPILSESDCDAMPSFVDDWDELAASASTPNVFYESWHLRPAWRLFGGMDALVALYRRGRASQDRPVLIGLVPTSVRATPSAWLGQRAELWTHPYGFLRTPLLRRGCTLEALDLWTRAAPEIWPGVSMALWERVHAEGPLEQAIVMLSRREGLRRVRAQEYSRAVCTPSDSDADAYIESAVSKKQRRELTRQQRRLSDLGSIRIRRPETADDAAAFAETFLELEAAGWKGENETAIAADATHADYFRGLIGEAFARGQLDASEMRLDERPVAVKLSFTSAGGGGRRIGFACKIGYDETLAKFSPGVLLELDTIRQMHQPDAPAMLDSCALPDHPMIDRLWSERVLMQHVAFTLPNAGWTTRRRLDLLRWRTSRRRSERSDQILTANY